MKKTERNRLTTSQNIKILLQKWVKKAKINKDNREREPQCSNGKIYESMTYLQFENSTFNDSKRYLLAMNERLRSCFQKENHFQEKVH